MKILKLFFNIFGVVFLLVSFFLFTHSSSGFQDKKDAFYCDAKNIITTRMDGHELTARLNITIISPSKGDGVVFTSGVVKKENEKYMVNRDSYYKSSPSDIDGVRKVVVINEKKKSDDNLPDDIWRKVYPESTGITYYSGMLTLGRNVILIKTLTKPIMVCIKR
ncbi:hypothetical protein NGK12_11505 [Raoultella ornithinolytica]|uniref:hypothetical protein n=1 Tax=Raoultella ornithinolytica TaxID=54291 RepID=UPI002DBAC464|nr:hypothetical protein [Raoultella ornithinolytica]MEB7861187.1 hypothetical protein [Raoultella ornithinolytica]MEB7983158.1 hypothetical protein [Raoultella ornithinolytica]